MAHAFDSERTFVAASQSVDHARRESGMEASQPHSSRFDMHKEFVVNMVSRRNSVLMRRGSLVRMQALPGNRVSCIRGMVWLTQEHDPTDRIVCAGETFVIDRPGVVLVNALAD